MYTEIIKIIEGAIGNDKQKVVSYARVLAKNLEQEGESVVARKIERIISKKEIHPVYLDGLLSKPVDQDSRLDILDVDTKTVELDLVLPQKLNDEINGFVELVKKREKLAPYGIDSSFSLLLYGPPGCGKTSIAQYISQQLEYPLVTAKLDAIVSSLLGSTAKNIRKVFEFAERQPCVLFLDEFDAIAKARDDEHELGELKRVVNTLLQNIDSYSTHNILIAATNHEKLLDPAIWRRFATSIYIGVPSKEGIEDLLEINLAKVDNSIINNRKNIDTVKELLNGFSHADIKNICHNAIKKFVIKSSEVINLEDFLYEVYLYKYHDTSNIESLVYFYESCSLSQEKISKACNISLRKVKDILKARV